MIEVAIAISCMLSTFLAIKRKPCLSGCMMSIRPTRQRKRSAKRIQSIEDDPHQEADLPATGLHSRLRQEEMKDLQDVMTAEMTEAADPKKHTEGMISIIGVVTIGETDAMTIGTLAAIRRTGMSKQTDTVAVDINQVSNNNQVATAVAEIRTTKEEAVMRDRVLMKEPV